MNYDGEVLCAVGDIGPKVGSLGTNYAVRKADGRQVGSTIKPITTYGYGIETGQISWGSPIKNYGIFVGEDGNMWPFNYGREPGNGQNLPVYYALQKSFNTAPAQLCQQFGIENVYKFATEKMGLQLDSVDKDNAPLIIGALHKGITLENLVNAYIPYGNRGIYNEAHIISRIEDSTQQVIYQNDGNPRSAVSDETAWVMNRLLKNVVENGTGTAAKLSNKVVVGKTGTTENWYDECFVGLTRDFVSGMTMGYKYNNDLLNLNGISSAQIWYNIIGDYANNEFLDTPRDFDAVKSVIEAPMCTSTNQIAGQYCGKGPIGYWKSEQTETYSPPYCAGAHGYSSGTTTGGGSTTGGTTGGGATGGDATGGGATGGYTGGDATGGATGGDATGGGATGGDATGGGYTGGDATGGDATGGGYTGGDATGGGDVGGGDATGGF
jgi:penicillin-binding protein 1A